MDFAEFYEDLFSRYSLQKLEQLLKVKQCHHCNHWLTTQCPLYNETRSDRKACDAFVPNIMYEKALEEATMKKLETGLD